VAGGIAGLVAASEAASAAIAGTFAAIVPGTLLLAFAYWGVLNAAPTHWRPLNMPSTSGLHARTSSGTATPAAIVKKARPFPQEKGHGSTLFEPASGLHRTPRSPTSAPPHERTANPEGALRAVLHGRVAAPDRRLDPTSRHECQDFRFQQPITDHKRKEAGRA
jgi:hypothetical protein